MKLTPTVYDQIDDVPAVDWSRVVSDPTDLAMDPRLLSAFQSTMRDQCRCWFVILRDGDDQPIASACLCLFRIDALETTSPINRAVTRQIRRLLPGYMRFNVLFCGLPVPSAENHLRIAEGADRGLVLRSLDEVMRRLARENRARMIVVKEFEASRRDELAALESMGYLPGDVPCARRLDSNFNNFEEYCAALRARYRKQVKESVTRFQNSGCEVQYVTGPAMIDAMTDEMHRLYLAVRDRAKYRMETFPVEFFHEVARQFGDDAALTIIRKGQDVLGFAFSISAAGECHNLYVGLDYARNAEADVYFNLHYLDFDRAFRNGCTRIHLGQTGDEFKSRIGCSATPLLFYVRAVNPLLHAALRKLSRFVFPPVVQPTVLNVFRSADASTPRYAGGSHVPMGDGRIGQRGSTR